VTEWSEVLIHVRRGDEFLVGDLRRQIALDLSRLGLLGGCALIATALAVGGRGLEPALALAPQHRDLVVATGLQILLKRVGDQA